MFFCKETFEIGNESDEADDGNNGYSQICYTSTNLPSITNVHDIMNNRHDTHYSAYPNFNVFYQ